MPTTSATPPPRPLQVVFVGAFQTAGKDGSVGGTLFAARSLVASGLSEHVRWVLIDSTGRSVPPPPVPVRAYFAARRMVRFVAAVLQPSTDAALIFAGSGLGFLEKGTMALVAHAAGKPVLLSPRSGMMIAHVTRSRAYREFVRFVLARTDRIICQGESWRRFYEELTGLPASRLVSIPNWVELATYSSIRTAPRQPGPPVFLYLGWIERYKGALDLLHAVHRRRSDLGGARVIICGRGDALPEARRLAEELDISGIVTFRGWVHGDEKLAALAEADVLVLPSHIEGLPNALLEAMATGLAVIATRVGSIPDVIEHGTTGLLVDPGDVNALGDALVQFARDPGQRERLGRAAQQKIARDHDVNVAWPHLLEAMVAITDQSPAQGGETAHA